MSKYISDTVIYENIECNKNAFELFTLLSDRKAKVAFAESLTGGMLTSTLVDIPGSSSLLDGSVVSYSNSVKIDKLKVPKEVIDSVGPVSSECAEAMASGVLNLMNSNFAVSVTGIAGPGGEEEGKPVGTVYIGIASDTGYVDSYRFVFEGDRTEVRRRTCDKALSLICDYIKGIK
ncbi:MAG: CinA family protein [Clostridia bacterium]|nr:CinA family protein [Clostridia bacterium]